MTLGEIKIAAIKLMFDNLNRKIDVSELKALEDSVEYGHRLINMNEAINRALDRFTVRGKLPFECVELSDYIISENDKHTRYDLSGISDFYRIGRVIYDGDIYYPQVPYRTEGTYTLLLETLPSNAEYRLVYYPRARHITDDYDYDDAVKLPDNLASLIPYFVKAELYEEDEPQAANAARQVFENGLDYIDNPDTILDGSFKAVYTEKY